MSTPRTLHQGHATDAAFNVQKTQGFAVVIALTLMSFVLVLVLSLSSLISVETSLAKTQKDQLAARQNARLAALIALGDLQKTMGPDMRVSARAEIVSTENVDDPDSGVSPFDADEATRFWTGVWDSEDWDPGLAEDREGRFQRWLVSIPEDAAFGEIDAVAPENPIVTELGDADKTVALARISAIPEGATQPEETDVRAYLRPVSENGAIAWWVSDEGVKANPGLVDDYQGQAAGSLVEDIPRFLFPHRHNFRATRWFARTDFNDADFTENLKKVGSTHLSLESVLASADLEADAETAIIEGKDSLFADYSFYTHGVLSSNRRGGLRGDLSLAFYRPESEVGVFNHGSSFASKGFENDFRKRRIFDYQSYPETDQPDQVRQSVRSSAADGKNFYAARWEVLRDFHNSFQKIENRNSPDALVRPLQVNGGKFAMHTHVNSNASSGFFDGEWQASFGSNDDLHMNAPADPTAEILNAGRAHQPVESVTSHVAPVVLRMNWAFQLAMVQARNDDDALKFIMVGEEQVPVYQPEIRFKPTITLWNPYNVAVTNRSFSGATVKLILESWFRDIAVEFDMGGETYHLANGPKDSSGRLTNTLSGASDKFFIGIDMGPESLAALGPGEIRAYSVSSIQSSDTEGDLFDELELSPFFPPSDTYFSFSDVFRGVGALERIRGETLSVTTRIKTVSGGLRFSSENLGFSVRGQPAVDLVTHDVSLTVGSGGVFPINIGSLDLHLRPGPEVSSAAGDLETFPRLFADFNVRARYPRSGWMGNVLEELPNYWFGFLPGPGDVDYQISSISTATGTLQRGRWGPSIYPDEGGQSFVTLFDVPRRPPESLGQYQHAHVANKHPHQPTFPIGNSEANPYVPRQHAIHHREFRTFMDYSWFLNDALFDDYFLSTIDPYDIDERSPERLAPLRSRFVELDSDIVYDPTGEADYKTVAENLLLKGAFNVNSVSVEAWTALLSSLGGEGVQFFRPSTNESAQTAELQHPFHRLSIPMGAIDTAWTGGPRDLTSGQIQSLAENIVEEVKKRGPFLSLSDFINRRLSGDERGMKGAIQAALDADSESIQTVLEASDPVVLPGVPAPENVEGTVNDFAPGYLTQADVLTSLAPVLAVRSDTFVIRSYGRTTTLNGLTNGEAWCEMVVQRFPEAHTETSMGRPFRILSFRYLNKDEI